MVRLDPALRLRVLSALVLIPLALGVAVVGGWFFTALVALCVVLMGLEWRQLIAARFGVRHGWIAGAAALAVALVVVALSALDQPDQALAAAALGALAAGGIAWWLDAPPLWTSLGALYLSLPALALIWLRALPEIGLAVLLWLLVVVWATDVVAYFVGRGIGGPKLAPRVSPGKTWSGLCGGMAGAALIGLLAAALGGSERLLQAAGLGAVLAVVAQVGDLAESALKRQAGVKDSGALIPGHGGVLDRLDGLLFAAPALALLGLLLGPWGLPWP